MPSEQPGTTLPESTLYEKFQSQDDFLITYHFEEESAGSGYVTPAHWHEHIELLCVAQGELRVHIHGHLVTALPGDLVIINSGEIHAIPEKDDETRYACLIAHMPLCTRMAFPVEDICFFHHIRDSACTGVFRAILQLLREQPPFYKTIAQAQLLVLLADLGRRYSANPASFAPRVGHKAEIIVRRAISYLQANYLQDISTRDVSAYLGFNNAYVCSCFREVTGNTVLEYLNILRCEHAKNLISSGQFSIAECAARSGFTHQSYFTKTYKKFIGELPRETAKTRPTKKC